MDASRFDRISKLFAQRRARNAMAQEATPAAPIEEGGKGPELLFVQTYRAGAIAPIAGADGRYALTLEAGTGQTVYFSDRPDRLVGADPTPQFLDRLGFPDDNPPNAALVIEKASGETGVAVVELYSPAYDEATGGVTYEVAVLEDWGVELGVGLPEAPTDLAALAPSFGATHLFIDGFLDCPDGDIVCRNEQTGEVVGTIPGAWFHNFCSRSMVERSTSLGKLCVPCSTLDADIFYDARVAWGYWSERCYEMFPACSKYCQPSGWCQMDPYWQNTCPDYS